MKTRKLIASVVIPAIMVAGWLISYQYVLQLNEQWDAVLKPLPGRIYVSLAYASWNSILIRIAVGLYQDPEKKHAFHFNVYPFLAGLVILIPTVTMFGKIAVTAQMIPTFTMIMTLFLLALEY